MKSAILALAVATGLALSAGSASAHPPGYGGGYYGGYHHHGYYGGGYYGGYYAPRPVVIAPVVPVGPVYPAYGYGYSPYYRPGVSITIGSGYGYGSPYGGGYFRW